jgi:hypothetical protein
MQQIGVIASISIKTMVLLALTSRTDEKFEDWKG